MQAPRHRGLTPPDGGCWQGYRFRSGGCWWCTRLRAPRRGSSRFSGTQLGDLVGALWWGNRFMTGDGGTLPHLAFELGRSRYTHAAEPVEAGSAVGKHGQPVVVSLWGTAGTVGTGGVERYTETPHGVSRGRSPWQGNHPSRDERGAVMAEGIGMFMSPEKRAAAEWAAVNDVVLELSDGNLKEMLVGVLDVTYAEAMGGGRDEVD